MKSFILFLLCLIPALLADEVFIIPQGLIENLSAAVFAQDSLGATIIDILNLPNEIDLRVVADGDFTLNIDTIPLQLAGKVITSLAVGGSTGTQTVTIGTALSLSDALTVNANGVLVVNEQLEAAAANIVGTVQQNADMIIDGVLNIAGSVQQNADMIINGVLNIEADASLIWNAGSITGDVVNILAGAQLTVAGTNPLTLIGTALNIDGTLIQQNTDSLTINAPVTINAAGLLRIDAAALLTGTGAIVNRGRVDVDAAASLALSLTQADNTDALLNINAALSVAADAVLDIALGLANIAANVELNIDANGALNLGDAILQGDGALSVAGALNWNNGRINLAGTTTILAGGQLVSAGGATLEINNGQLLVQGTWNQDNTARVILNVETIVDGLVNLQGDAVISGSGRIVNNNDLNILNNLNIGLQIVNNARLLLDSSTTVTANIVQDAADAVITLADRVVFSVSNSATLDLLRGSLVANGENNVLIVGEGANLNVNGAISGNLNAQISGLLNLAGSINIEGSIDIAKTGRLIFTNGEILGSGNLNILSDASIATSPAAGVTLAVQKTLRIAGDWLFETEGAIELRANAVIESGGQLLLDAAASIRATGDAALNVNGGAVVNVRDGEIAVRTTNNGLIQVLADAIISADIVQQNADARILINPSATLTLGGDSILELRAGLLTRAEVGGDSNAGNLVVLAGSRVLVNGISTVTGNILARIEGELELEGTLSTANDINVLGIFAWVSGRLNGSGALRVQNNGVLRSTGSANLVADKSIVILGSWEQQNSAAVQLNEQATIEAGGVLTVAAGVINGVGNIVNNGVVAITADTRLAVGLVNNARLVLEANLEISASLTQSNNQNALITLRDAELRIVGETTLILQGGQLIEASNESKKRLDAANRIFVEAGSTFDMDLESLVRGAIDIVVEGTFVQEGNVETEGEIQVSGRYYWRWGNNVGEGSFNILANGRFETTNEGDIELGVNRALTVAGEWLHSGTGALTVQSNIVIEDGGRFVTQAAGTIRSNDDTAVTFTVEAGGSAVFNQEAEYNLDVSNHGRVEVRDKIVKLQTFTQDVENAVFQMLDATVVLLSDAEARFERGVAHMRGKIEGSVVFSGTVRLDIGGEETRGNLVIDGDLYVEEGAVIVIEVEDESNYDRIEVTGTAFLRGGSVRFVIINSSYIPQGGARYEFLKYSNKEGELREFDAEGEFSVEYVETEDGTAAVVTSVEQSNSASSTGVSMFVMAAATVAALAISAF